MECNRESCAKYYAEANRQQSQRRSSALSEDEVFDQKYKAAIKAYHNYMEGFQLVLAENERKMNNILNRRLFPLWFQELSDGQVTAMDQLLEAIRDDLNEDTVFRCRELIRNLGVHPLCPTMIFREALFMSRGNDLSFLWYLLELHYSKNRRKDYTNNERLIMSAICHLDMMTTLRGLERILPPPAPRKCCRRKRSSETLTWPAGQAQYCSPYLESQRVREIRLKSFTGKRLKQKVPFCLNRYSQYCNPEFVIPNEESRWFARRVRATYPKVKAGEEEQSEVLRRKIPLSSACDSAELIVRELLNDQIALMIGREQERAELCRKHQDMDRRRQQLMGLVTKRTEAREKINEAVAKARDERKLAEQTAKENRMIQVLLRRLIDDSIVTCLLTPRSACPECWEAYERQRKLLDGTKCSCDKEPGVFCLRSMLALNEQKPLQKFFRCCRGPIPYEFDYRKILEDGIERPICPVKKAIRVALGMEQDDVDESEAVARCMKEMWRCELKLWNERFLKGREEARERKTEIDMLDYQYVDSKDPVCLQQLLKRALLKLCEDPKYVLATFPDAHELPFLNAWIQNRYGVIRSEDERDELLQESKYFWEWLIPKVTAMKWPVCKDLGMHGRVNWNYKQRLERNAQAQLAKFYRKFKRLQLQENRLYWSTMDPYRTNVDRFRQIFFDYLPNCEPSMGPMVRPWRQCEFRPMESLSRSLKACDSRTKC